MKPNVFSLFVFFIVLITALTSVRAQDYLVDPSFNPAFGGRTHPFFDFNNVVVVQPDQKILVGGNFTTVNGASCPLIARLNADGSRDAAFNSALGAVADDFIETIELLPNGKMLISGVFRISGARTTFVRLNSDGSLDNSFSAVGGRAKDIETYADGKFMACGGFSSDGLLLARFNQDGSRDASFQANLSGNECLDVELLPDGKMFAAGRITGMNGVGVRGLVKLNADGSRDTTFNPPPDNSNVILKEFFRLALQPDGNLLASYRAESFDNAWSGVNRYDSTGAFQSFSSCLGYSASPSNFIFLQNDGRIITSGCRSQANSPAYNFARLNSDGTVDGTLNRLDFNGYTPIDIDRQADGKYLVVGYFNSVDGVARQRIARLAQPPESVSRRFDFDGDGKADVSVFRPSSGFWYVSNSSNNSFSGAQFGFPADRLVPADYDGDGKTDIAVYRNGTWYLQRSQSGFIGIAFGAAGDVPVPADYDGDGRADVAVFRPSNGTWYLLQSFLGYTEITFGQTGDKPVAADYDGDGRADIAVNRSGTWYLLRSQLGFTGIAFGDGADKPVPADYDGDGKADVAVFRPSNGTWYLLKSQLGFTALAFGFGTDLPVPADYDGDGITDIAVLRNGAWYLNRSTAGFTGVTFGTATDKPVPNAFIP